MYRVSEEVAKKLLKNIKNPDIGPFDLNQKDPFRPKNTKSIGFIDPYAAIGVDFDFLLEIPYPYINPSLPPVNVLDGYWLYKKEELSTPNEAFHVPRYLADPNVQNGEEEMDVTDCAVVLPSDVDKLTCKSIVTFEQLVKLEPAILDCLHKEIK